MLNTQLFPPLYLCRVAGAIRSQAPVRVGQTGISGKLLLNRYKNRATAFLIAISAVLECGILAHIREVQAQQLVSFDTQDSGLVYANLYGKGDHGVVLAHGGRFNKESWEKQARALAAAGFRVMAIDFRGYGQSKGPGQSDPLSAPLHYDVLAAVRYLRRTGTKTVSVIGASMGGGAAADALIVAEPGEIDRLVLLAASIGSPPEKLKGRKLFITTRDDTTASGTPRLVRIREQYERAPKPKELVILDGSAHAQFIFQTAQGEQLMKEILRFLSAP